MGLFAQVDLVNEKAFVTSEAFQSAAAIERGYSDRLQELGLHTCMENVGHVSLSCGMRAYAVTLDGLAPSSMIGMLTFRLASHVQQHETAYGFAFNTTERTLAFRVIFLPKNGLAFENGHARPMTERAAYAFGRHVADTITAMQNERSDTSLPPPALQEPG